MNYICKCNNCGSFLLDENPQVHAPQFHISPSFAVQPMEKDDEGNWVCPICMTDSYLSDVELDTFNPHLYYRLYDNQTGGYLASSYNAVGLKAWAEEFLYYYTSDADDDLAAELNALSPDKVVQVAGEAGFSIEVSEYPFEMDSIDLYFLTEIPASIVKEVNWTPDDGVQLVLQDDTKWHCQFIALKNNIFSGDFYQ
jgi:hypothetical protein